MKRLLFFAFIILITSQAQAEINRINVRDFAIGTGIGATHGLFNKYFAPNALNIVNTGYPDFARIDIKLIPIGTQLMSLYVANSIENKIISHNGGPYYYWHQRPVVEKFGHALAQGIVEGSSYDNQTKSFKLGFSFNMTLLFAINDYLWVQPKGDR